MKERTKNYINEFLSSYKEMEYLIPAVVSCVDKIVSLNEKKILVCGNGGSAADCEHFSAELLKSFMLKRRIPDDLKKRLLAYPDGEEIANNLQQGVKVIPIPSLSSFNSAYLNDTNTPFAFAQLVNVLGVEGDLLFAISTSGNSKNVVAAAKVAKAKGLTVAALTGKTGGELKKYCDILLNVPSDVVYKIQEYHLPVYHLICLCAESELYDE